MASDHGSSWSPDVVGPLDRCARCWTPIGEEIAICETCGHVSLVFNSLPVESGERCASNDGSAAEWTCCLCQRPICKQCRAIETNPFTTFGPLWHCHACVDSAKRIEAAFFQTLAATKCCAKHRELPMAFNCTKCKIQLCLSCTYFTAKGLFKKRPADGPYCLGCFRMATLHLKRNGWYSGHDLAPSFFLAARRR